MTDRSVVQRDETIFAVLMGAFVLALVVCILLSARPLFYGSRPQVVAGDPLPAGALPGHFKRIVDSYGLHVPKEDRRPIVALGQGGGVSDEDGSGLRFGYSIREGAAAGLPFRAWKDEGHVLYYETEHEFVMALITDDYLRQVGVAMKKPLDDGDFSFWRYRWGWLFVIAALGILLFHLGAQKRKRAALDLI